MIEKSAILNCEIFLFLATANSKSSAWCPWEIGYADAGKRIIIIIPTSDSSYSYGNEYLNLYPRIDEVSAPLSFQSSYQLFKVGASNGTPLSPSVFK